METPNSSNGIPVVVAGIPTVQTSEGIVSPFPYLNSESEEWKGADEEGLDDGGGVAILDPNRDPDDFGGDEAEDDEDDEDDIDDNFTGFGVGAFLSTFFAPPQRLSPA